MRKVKFVAIFPVMCRVFICWAYPLGLPAANGRAGKSRALGQNAVKLLLHACPAIVHSVQKLETAQAICDQGATIGHSSKG